MMFTTEDQDAVPRCEHCGSLYADDVCGCGADKDARIAKLEKLLLTALALHGATAFTHSEIEWRATARAELGLS